MARAYAATISTLAARVREKTRDRQSIFNMAVIVFKTNISTQALVLLGSVLLVRHISKDEYGLWRVVVSLIAFVQLMSDGFDQAITRFVPVEAKEQKDAIVLAVFAANTLLTVAGAAILLALYSHLPSLLNVPVALQPLFVWLFWLLILSMFATCISTTLFAVARAHKLYHFILRVTLAKQVTMFACILGVIVFNRGVGEYVFCDVVMTIVQIGLLSWGLAAVVAERGGDLWGWVVRPGRVRAARSAWREYVRGYSGPLNFASMLSYVRGYVPIIILGSQFSLTQAAIYSILKNILTTLHKMQGGVEEGLFPRVFELYEVNRSRFVRNFHRYMTGAYGFRLLVGLAVFAGAPIICWAYRIELTSTVMIVLAILVLEYLMTQVVSVSNLAVMLSKNTMILMYSAGFRFVLEIFLLLFVTLRFGIVGAAITLFLARSAEGISTIYASTSVLPLRRQYTVFAVLMSVFALVVLRFVWMA